MTEPTYSVSDAARALDVTRQTVYRWLDEGRLEETEDAAGKLRAAPGGQRARHSR